MEVKAQETTWVEERKVSFVKSHVTTNKYTYDIESINYLIIQPMIKLQEKM